MLSSVGVVLTTISCLRRSCILTYNRGDTWQDCTRIVHYLVKVPTTCAIVSLGALPLVVLTLQWLANTIRHLLVECLNKE